MAIDTNRFKETFPAFKDADDSLINEIIRSSNLVKFVKDNFLYSEGDACAGIGFFLSGSVRVFKISESGREITLYEIEPGETCILNASCILSGSNYPALAQALSDGEALIMPDSVFRRLIRDHEEMRAFVFDLFSDRLSIVMELIDEVAFGRMDQRLMDHLVEKSADGVLESTHQVIANDLGTSREVVSRVLKDLERQGVVKLSRNRIELSGLT
jgi:CRP/FNR family transcriptional regulator